MITRISDRVSEVDVGPCRLLLLPVDVPQVVSWAGSIATYPNLERGEALVQTLTADLLDKGTRLRDRFALSDELERRGARLTINASGLRISFRGRTLEHDMPEVMALLAEILTQPLLNESEFVKAKARLNASLEHARDSTAQRAQGALSRRLYCTNHPAFLPALEDTLQALATLSVDDIHTFYKGHMGPNDLVMAMTGDLNLDACVQAAEATFTHWAGQSTQATHVESASPEAPGQVQIPMKEKPALDVRLGHAIRLRRTDADWLPLHVATYILGGNFSSRLMKRVRQELGLTYGISAHLQGLADGAEGYYSTSMSLGAADLARGLDATRSVIEEFVREGPSAKELEEKKTTIAGAYQVGLSTTGSIAGRLHSNAVRGLEVAYLDEFVNEVKSLTLERVREVLSKHISPAALHTVVAGTLPE